MKKGSRSCCALVKSRHAPSLSLRSFSQLPQRTSNNSCSLSLPRAYRQIFANNDKGLRIVTVPACWHGKSSTRWCSTTSEPQETPQALSEDEAKYQRMLVNAESRFAEGQWLDINKFKSLVEGKQFADNRDRIIGLLEKGLEQSDSSFVVQYELAEYNQLIKALAENGCLKQAFLIFDFLENQHKKRCNPDIDTFSSLLQGYKTEKDAKGAVELLTKMGDRKIEPTAEFTHELVVLCKGEDGMAFQAFEEARKMSPTMVPLVQTFNTLIECCIKEKSMPKVLEIREIMESYGIKETEETFNEILLVTKELRDVESAIQIFTEMKDLEVKPNLRTYNILLQIFGVARDLERSVAILSTMEKEQIKLDALSFSALVEMNVLREDWDKAGRIIKMMKEKGWLIAPDTFASVFSVLLGEMNESQALLVLKFIKQQGIVLETPALILLLDHFGRHDRLDIFLIELRQFELEGLKHRKESLHILLRLSVAKENLDLVYLYLQKMKRMGEKVVQDTLNDLKLLLYRQKRTEGIERLFNLVDEVMNATEVRVQEEDRDLPYELEERIRRVARPRKSRKAKEEEDRLRARAAQQAALQQAQQQTGNAQDATTQTQQPNTPSPPADTVAPTQQTQ